VKPNIHAASGVPDLKLVLGLYRERANNLNQLAKDIAYFYAIPQENAADAEKHITAEVMPAMQALLAQLNSIEWHAEAIHGAINAVVSEFGLKFPKIAMPLRVMLTGIAQSPSIDQVMFILGKSESLARIQKYLT
jgi:glutamyl-tRNA synthetase